MDLLTVTLKATVVGLVYCPPQHLLPPLQLPLVVLLEDSVPHLVQVGPL